MNTPDYPLIRRLVQGALCGALLITNQLIVAVPAITYARPLDKALCRLDRQGWGNGGDAGDAGDAGGSGVGQQVVLSQPFTPRVHSRICAVRLKLRRNVGRAQAGLLRLALVTHDHTIELARAAIPADAIPVGTTSEQTFSFGCDGPGMPAALFYELQLSSPGSMAEAYTWVNGDVWRNGAIGNGERWRSLALGHDSLVAPRSADYDFQVFTCQ